MRFNRTKAIFRNPAGYTAHWHFTDCVLSIRIVIMAIIIMVLPMAVELSGGSKRGSCIARIPSKFWSTVLFLNKFCIWNATIWRLRYAPYNASKSLTLAGPFDSGQCIRTLTPDVRDSRNRAWNVRIAHAQTLFCASSVWNSGSAAEYELMMQIMTIYLKRKIWISKLKEILSI